MAEGYETLAAADTAFNAATALGTSAGCSAEIADYFTSPTDITAGSSTGLLPQAISTSAASSATVTSFFSPDKDNALREANKKGTEHYYTACVVDTTGTTDIEQKANKMDMFELGASAGFAASALAVAVALSF